MSEKSLLDSGEELVWSGKPSAIWFAVRRAWKPSLVGILLLFASISYLLGPAFKQLPGQSEQSLNNLIAISRGLYTAAGIVGAGGILAAICLWLRATRTTYLLTNRRVVIDTAGPIPRRTSMPLEHVRFIEYRSKLIGPADLVFNETRRFSLDGWGLRGEGFIATADAKQIEGLVRGAIEKTFATRTRGPWQ